MPTARRTFAVLFSVFAFSAPRVHAQEPGKAGLTMGIPGSVGLLFRASDTLAVRPYFTFMSSSTAFAGDDGDTTTAGGGVSAIVYVARHDSLRTYVAPDVNVRRIKTSGDSPVTSTATSLSTAGLFGAEYTLSSRFGVFAEVGLRYSHSSSKTSGSIVPVNVGTTVPTISIDDTISGHAWQTVTGIGAILYF